MIPEELEKELARQIDASGRAPTIIVAAIRQAYAAGHEAGQTELVESILADYRQESVRGGVDVD